jgi:hypothetical protein
VNDAALPTLVTLIPDNPAIPVALKTTGRQLRPAAVAVTVFGPGFAPSASTAGSKTDGNPRYPYVCRLVTTRTSGITFRRAAPAQWAGSIRSAR